MSSVLEEARKKLEELKNVRKQINEEIKETYSVIKDNTPKDSIIIVNPKIARNLIKKGHEVIDIKPNKKDKYRKRSVYVFKLDDTIEEDFNNLKSSKNLENE